MAGGGFIKQLKERVFWLDGRAAVTAFARGKVAAAVGDAWRTCTGRGPGASPRGGLPESRREFTVCVLIYGSHQHLARRCLGSLLASLPEGREYVKGFRVGLNEVCPATQDFVKSWGTEVLRTYGVPVLLYTPTHNVGKYPLMRRMFHDPDDPLSKYVMWFDDDSYLQGVERWWPAVSEAIRGRDMIGQLWNLPVQGNQWEWIKTQPWFNPEVRPPRATRRRPPSYRFCQGAWWVLRSEVVRRYDWPVPELHHCGGDSLLGELCRHRGLRLGEFDYGVRINADESGTHSAAPRRGMSHDVVGKNYVPGQPVDLSHHNFTLDKMRIQTASAAASL